MINLQEISYFQKADVLAKFEQFKNILIEHNKEYNLTSILERDDVFIKHFYDSLKGEKYIKEGAKVCEIGSGGGFPSVPIKIYRPDIFFTLIETVGKKCRHLEIVKSQLGFENFNILKNRCEVIAKDEKYREKFDVVIARAVASLNTLCEYMLPLIRVGGIMIAYKGDNDEIDIAKRAIEILGGKVKEVEKYVLPYDYGARSLVIIEKIKNTPPKYPRGNGKERSKPL